jgi:hypothetical protein
LLLLLVLNRRLLLLLLLLLLHDFVCFFPQRFCGDVAAGAQSIGMRLAAASCPCFSSTSC